MKQIFLLLVATTLMLPPMLAQAKSADEIYAEAEAYWNGNDSVWMNRTKALELYQQAAELGHSIAQYTLGQKYFYGEGVPKDLNQAAYWTLKSVDELNVISMYQLSLIYDELGDNEQTVHWTRLSAEGGFIYSIYNLGLIYRYGRYGMTTDISQAEFWFRKAAEEGFAEAQYELAYIFIDKKDNEQAIYWMQKAAENGLGNAQGDLAYSYENSELGLTEDLEQAAYWYHQAIESGVDDMFTQCEIGLKYVRGELGFEQDYKKAVYRFKLSADQGYEVAQYSLGITYLNGKGIPKDQEKGMFYLKQAAEQGFAEAQYNLGLIYRKMNKYDEAFHWFSLAAKQGHASSQLCLGLCYYAGEGTKRDKKKSKYWMQKAAEQGDDLAIKWLQDHR